MPPAALVYGAILLGEPITIASVGALALIMVGVGLGSGVLTLVRRRAAIQEP
jgi:drug/metabolite transporter (DMT)-like permease